MQRDARNRAIRFHGGGPRRGRDGSPSPRPKQLRKFSYVDRGRYAEQLERALPLIFHGSDFLVIKYEEFSCAFSVKMVETVFRFLGLSPPRFRAVEAHDIPYARKLRDEERAAVREILQSDIVRLEALLGWDCSDWR